MSIRLDDAELCKLHALAERSDVPIAMLVRAWLADQWRATFGDAAPPPAMTKRGDALRPRTKR